MVEGNMNDKIMELIEGYCSLIMEEDTISLIKGRIGDTGIGSELTRYRKFDKITAEEFFVVYKLDKLERRGIISPEKRQELTELFMKKTQIYELLDSICYIEDMIEKRGDSSWKKPNFDEEKKELFNELNYIMSEIDKYHLFGVMYSFLDFSTRMDEIISNEEYPKEDTK